MSTGGPDDRQLLAAHVEGDPEAFGELVRRHRDRLWAVAVRTTGNREDAADALQDALLSAFRGAAAYRGDASVTTWLHRIVVNAGLDRLRRRAARPAVPLDGHEPPSGRDEHARAVTRLDVVQALATLPEDQRTALVLVVLEERPVAEVARLLGVAEGTIKSRCARARLALAARLRDGDGAGDGAAAGATRATTGSAGNQPAPAPVTPTTAPTAPLSAQATGALAAAGEPEGG